MYVYKAKLDRVVDGDTIDAIIDLGFDITVHKRIRLAGINTPESRTRDLEEKFYGKQSKYFLEKLLKDKKIVILGLPGAFTPTCSSTHLPGYEEKYDTFKKLGIDEIGLDEMDRKILRVIIEQFSGGPVGLKSLAVAVGEDSTTIEDVYEPFLIKEGMIMRTSRGRLAQELAYDFLGLKKTKDQQRLFNDK